MLWSALWPRRTRGIYVATACVFVWWKSPSSQPVIDGWNALFSYHIERVVDFTDLVALLAMPVSIGYLRLISVAPGVGGMGSRVAPVVLCVSVLAFAATSHVHSGVEYDFAQSDATTTYALALPPAAFADRLDASGLFHGSTFGPLGSSRDILDPSASGIDRYLVSLDNDCRNAIVEVAPLFDGTAVRLVRLTAEPRCKAKSRRDDLRAMFEGEVISRLRGDRATTRPTRNVKGERFDYPPDAAPSIELTGSRADIARRLDRDWIFSHDFHDGIYQLSAVACYGRFRMTELPDGAHVVITGIGFNLPCFSGASQDCLTSQFRTFVSRRVDPTPTVVSSPASGSLCTSLASSLKPG